jgi:predicted secreted protein
MTLLITVFAAVAVTTLWYARIGKEDYRLGTLALMYWGASLMWMVDAVFEYAELKAEYFVPAAGDMLNDSFLGLSVVALGLIIWLVILFVKDPQGKVRQVLREKR